MRTVDVETLRTEADELVAKAIAGEPVVIEQNGKHAVLMPCQTGTPDFQLYPETDLLLKERLDAPAAPPAAGDWERLRKSIGKG